MGDRTGLEGLRTLGPPGPLTKHEGTSEAFTSPQTLTDCTPASHRTPATCPSKFDARAPHEDGEHDDRDTGIDIVTRVRSGQTALRMYLVDGRSLTGSRICGQQLTKELLVAGHIMPRSTLSNTQRRRFNKIAMLLCLLGRDAPRSALSKCLDRAAGP